MVVFIDIIPNWGFSGIIKQVWHPGGDTLMEYLPREDGFPSGFALKENHPPSGDIPSGYPHRDVIFV